VSKYVIIGGSVGGIGAVEAIRELDPVGTITVVSEEPFPQYSRPMIADFLSKEADLDKMKYRDNSFWKENRVQAFIGRKAVKINFKERHVELDGEDKISFEKLLIATGGKPFVPKMEGLEKDGVFTFTKLSDAVWIATRIRKAKKAVVVGGGLIGVSATEALVKLGIKVTMVELKDRILSLILDATASEIITKAIEKAGVTIVTGQTVQRIIGKREDEDAVGGVILTDGKEVPCDLVVIAIGVIPRTELIAGTEIKVNRGILVDRFMRTNVPDVYACGDVAEGYDFIVGESRVLPLWPVAHIGGRVAGYNMAGKITEYPGGTAMSALPYFGIPTITVGIVDPKENDGCEVLTMYDAARNIYEKIVLKDNVIVGFIFVNEIERAGIFFHLMKNRVDTGSFKQRLLAEDFGLISLPQPLRQKMLLGEMM
jgi:NAD(P)H-nitrite reductase large subunit